jgi:hypothetical protein
VGCSARRSPIGRSPTRSLAPGWAGGCWAGHPRRSGGFPGGVGRASGRDDGCDPGCGWGTRTWHDGLPGEGHGCRR